MKTQGVSTTDRNSPWSEIVPLIYLSTKALITLVGKLVLKLHLLKLSIKEVSTCSPCLLTYWWVQPPILTQVKVTFCYFILRSVRFMLLEHILCTMCLILFCNGLGTIGILVVIIQDEIITRDSLPFDMWLSLNGWLDMFHLNVPKVYDIHQSLNMCCWKCAC